MSGEVECGSEYRTFPWGTEYGADKQTRFTLRCGQGLFGAVGTIRGPYAYPIDLSVPSEDEQRCYWDSLDDGASDAGTPDAGGGEPTAPDGGADGGSASDAGADDDGGPDAGLVPCGAVAQYPDVRAVLVNPPVEHPPLAGGTLRAWSAGGGSILSGEAGLRFSDGSSVTVVFEVGWANPPDDQDTGGGGGGGFHGFDD